MNQHYLPRTLSNDGKIYSETELLAASDLIVVLAEPGAGKTELLNSLATRLFTRSVTANTFLYIGSEQQNNALVIDAFDELAKIDQSGIHKLLAKAKTANPTHVIISSRSSEWDSAATHTVKEFLGHDPLLVRLCEFNQDEQGAIFGHHAPDDDFGAFYQEISRFDLAPLLPNPMFLKLFADAYIESGRYFTDKRAIFKSAVTHLAKEANVTIRTKLPLSRQGKVNLVSEIFAKMLLSGCDGVTTSESAENRIYPLWSTLVNNEKPVDGILATRLFKPGDNPDQHRPIHKIITEYCAADYLTKCIENSSVPLSLHQCLAIIAPNSVVRNELRGLLGWIATLGNLEIQRAAIELDPYAVLANGDPSQLEVSSKSLLLSKLKEIQAKDPYFRNSDCWRTFSVAGFFTPDIIEKIKPLIAIESDGHLRDLLLELLAGTSAVTLIESELRQIVLAINEPDNTRFLALHCLLETAGFLEIADDKHQADLTTLLSQGTQTSLKLITNSINKRDVKTLPLPFLAEVFRACAELYLKGPLGIGGEIGSRYFIKKCIAHLDLITIERLLDTLTNNLTCDCEAGFFRCKCLLGISKIVGHMLDRYFEQDRYFDLAAPPFEPVRIWQWLSNLNFHYAIKKNNSKSVQVLLEDIELRQGILAHVFGGLTDLKQIDKTWRQNFSYRSHFALCLSLDDHRFLVDLAFDTGNPNLWVSFIARHQHKQINPNDLRRHMRKQALDNPMFMREWVTSNRSDIAYERKQNVTWRTKDNQQYKRYQRKQEQIYSKNIQYLQENRELIERGRDWNFLVLFSIAVLLEPESIESKFGDEELVRNALKNCFEFITPSVPQLYELADTQNRDIDIILFAACLITLRDEGNLEKIDLRLLQTLKTKINMGYSRVTEEERKILSSEVDRLIFLTSKNAEDFLRQYVEPQLAHSEYQNPDVWLLRSEKAFNHLRPVLSIEWLGRYHDLGIDSRKTLFEMAARYAEREALENIISTRCNDLLLDHSAITDDDVIEEQREFWFLRAFYFLTDNLDPYFKWLKADKNRVKLFFERSWNMREDPNWPSLSSTKVEVVLNAFIDKWPNLNLPSSYETPSPSKEKAYRFLIDVIWQIQKDLPDAAIPVLNRLLGDVRFADLRRDLLSIRAGQLRNKALRDFEPPAPEEIVKWLDSNEIVTVEGLRQQVIQKLQEYQKDIDGGEFNSGDRFYENNKRFGELKASEIIEERLSLMLKPQSIVITSEHQIKNQNRIDFTASKTLAGKRHLLVTEVKGQWHKDLYTAARAQLYDKYAIHSDADQQGIYLVIWFGADEKVAGRKNHDIRTAEQLKRKIEETLPPELKGRIDVFVLDVSQSEKA